MGNFNFIMLLSLLITCTTIFSQNTSGEIMYGQNLKIMYGDTASIANSDLKNILIELFKEKQKALTPDQSYYTLKFNNNKSVFKQLNLMNNDGSNKLSDKLTKGSYYVNIVEESLYHKGNFLGENLIIYHEKPSYDEWQIKNERKIIRGYNCMKAETIRRNEIGVESKVTAWFSTDINLSFGPKNYFGLPGLIIELHEFGDVYYVRELNFENVKLEEVDPEDKRILSYDEYKKKANASIRF